MDTGEAAIDFLPRRSHQLIATPITPRLPPRSVVPVCRFAWAPRASARFSFYRSARSISSSRLALVSFLSLSRRVLPQFMAAKGATMGGGGVRSFFSCAVFLSSLSFASSLGSPRRGVGSFPFPTVAASAWVPHHLIRSVHLIRPHCPIISSHHGTEALVSVVFQASNDGMAVSSAHHLIPSPSWSVSPGRLVSCVSPGHLVHIYRVINADGTKDEASKRTRKNGEGPGRETGEQDGAKNRNENGNTTGTGRWAAQERQASKDNEDMRRNHEQEQDAPHPFSPDPLAAGSRRFAGLILSPAPGAWDERTAIS